MAGDLRSEALHLARQGVSDDLPLLSGLYRRVVQQGIVGRVERHCPRTAAGSCCVGEAVAQLRKTEDEVNVVASAAPPKVAELLRPMGDAARDARGRLVDGRPAEEPEEMDNALPDNASPWRALVVVLVMQGLRLAEEPDVARRAAVSKELDELEQIMQRAGHDIDELERSRTARPLSREAPLGSAPATPDRVREHKKTVHDLEKALERMKPRTLQLVPKGSGP